MNPLYHSDKQTTTIPATSGIYRIFCVSTGKCYVGSAKNLRRRWNEHRNNLRANTHKNPKLQSAFNKYGEEVFVFEILEFILIPEMLVPREQYWFTKINPFGNNGFNILRVAGSRLGSKASPETIEKLKIANKGRKHPPEFGANITKRQLGRKFSEMTRKKIGDAQRGIPRPERRGIKSSPEAIEKQRQALTGYKHTEDAKQNMAKAQTGRIHSIESRGKRRIALLGRIVSPETGAKIAEANRGRIASDETRAKMSAAHSSRERPSEEYASRRKDLILTDPNGVEHFVHGIDPFCKEHGLDSSAIAKVARGIYKHHRGWTARFPETI